LITDAFGGHGGIALYNRDLLTALCSYRKTDRVIAVARHASNSLEEMPPSLKYVVAPSESIASYLNTLFQQAKREKPFDLILCGHINLMPIAWLMSRWLRVPVLLEIYGIEAWQPTSRRLANRLVSKARLVTSISEYTRRKFLSWAGVAADDCVLLPNAIHAGDYGMGEPALEFIEKHGLAGRKVILTFGRLVSQERAKGFDEVLELLPSLIQNVLDILYVIAGDGPDGKRLIEKAEQLGIRDHVVFTGRVDESDKADLYRSADVYVMPSRGEGFGFVFLEAMACGVPVIASNQDGSLEAVQHGALGQVVDPDQPDQLFEAILAALELPRKIPEGLRDFSFENFSNRLFGALDRMVTDG